MPGVGSAVLGLGGPSLSLCTVHAPGAFVDFTNVGGEGGNNPYSGIQCGRAFEQAVSINGCVATIQAHGFVHSDRPNVDFVDGTTLAIRFQKTSATGGNLDVTIATPAGKVEVHGKAIGSVVMDTCP
jgi:hypothetical protein